MAAFSPHVNVETTGSWTIVSHFPGRPTTRSQLITLPRPARQTALRGGTLLLAILVVLGFLSTGLPCSQVYKKKLAGRHEGRGRRLAAGGEEEEDEDLLAQVLRECIGWQAESEDTAGAETRPEDPPTLPQILTAQQLYYPESAGVLTEGIHALPQAPEHSTVDQPHISHFESVDIAPSWVPDELFLAELFDPEKWQSILETLNDVSTPQNPTQPDPLETGTREKRSVSPSSFDDSAECKRQRVSSTQGPEGCPEVHAGLASVQQSTVTTDQHHQQALSEEAATTVVLSGVSHSAVLHSPKSALVANLQETSSTSPLPQQPTPTAPAASNQVASLAPLAPLAQAAASYRLPPPAPPMPPATHLYYRLPVVLSGPIRRSFSSREAFRHRSRRSPKTILPMIHRLLTQPTITTVEADLLVSNCEQLASHLYGHHRGQLSNKKPCAAASSLARRYVYAEILFCAIQVLGPAMRAENWWPYLMNLIASEYVAPAACRNSAANRLAQRLSAALALLKNGIRPSLKDTVDLKRELFKNQSLKLGFEDELWDDWRKDDDRDAGSPSS
ncbi:hypothetical protein ACSSS7_001312 [Eimeria intestinalis]